MKQFILNKKPGKDNLVRLKNNDYKYLVRVRRLAVGEFFPALLPSGEETQIKIILINNGVLTGECVDASFPSPCSPSPTPIILFQALPKGDKMDLIVRQAAEGGIAEIVPFVSEFSVAKTKAGGAAYSGQKFIRWERIVKEARQQSGSKIATTIRRPLTMKELFEYWDKIKEKADDRALGLLFHHQGVEKNSLHGYLNNVPKVTAYAIGPEGGFSDAEVSLFRKNEWQPVTIGDTILRTETAALYCAAAIRTLLLERDSWQLR